jgi:hypothetical protein
MGEMINAYKILVENLEGQRDYLENLPLDGIILKWI